MSGRMADRGCVGFGKGVCWGMCDTGNWGRTSESCWGMCWNC